MPEDYRTLMQPWHRQYGEQADAANRSAARFSRVFAAFAEQARVAEALERAQAALRDDLIVRVLQQSPEFFEHLIIDLLLAMGYGSRHRDLSKHLGRRGDGGVDGVIRQDELGLDLIYLQAKRYSPGYAVPVADVRDFVGALEAHHARKGVMVTTSTFTRSARSVIDRIPHQISLLDNTALADLMIRHNLGVSAVRTYQFKSIDHDYFASQGEPRHPASPSQQPRIEN